MDGNEELLQEVDARVTRCGRYSAWLKKAKSTNARFKLQGHVMRYFTIDFDAHIMFYSHSISQKKVSQPIPFMNILGAEELPLGNVVEGKTSKTSMIFGFMVYTKLRSFRLFTNSSADATQWTFALNAATLLGKLKCLERLKVLQDDGLQEHLADQFEEAAERKLQEEEEEEALKQVEAAAARKMQAESLRLLQIQLRAQDEVAAWKKQEAEAAAKKKEEEEVAKQKQVLAQQAANLQLLHLQLLVQEEEAAARQEEEEKEAARKKQKEAAERKKQEEEAVRRPQAAEMPGATYEPGLLVEALAIFLAQDVYDASHASEWKEILRLEEMQRSRCACREEWDAEHEVAGCRNLGSLVPRPSQVNVMVEVTQPRPR